jgi:phage-related protein
MPGVEIATAYVSLVPTAKGMQGNLEKELSGTAKAAGTKAGGILSGALGKAAALTGGVLAIGEVTDFLGDTLKAARESAKVTAQSEAVIKSTGNVANISADQMGDLANAIAAKTGVDDEAIQSGENLLRTFTDIRNGVGEGNQVFSDATSIMVDMSAALGQDMSSSAMQLGKALNDPVKGMTALQRVGVTFTKQQKDQVAAMAAAGDTAGAQQLILSELRKEFGGSAEAIATPWQKLKVTLGNVQEDLGAKLIPIADKVVTWLADELPGAIETATVWFAKAREQMAPVFERLAQAVAWARANFDTLKPVLAVIAIALAALFAPIVLVIAGIAALVVAYAKFEGFRNVVDSVARFIVDVVAPALAQFFGWLSDTVSSFVEWWKEAWPQVSEAVGHVIVVIKAIIEPFLDYIRFIWSTWGDDILRIIKNIWDEVSGIVSFAIDTVKNTIALALAIINGDWGKAWDIIKEQVGATWEFVKTTIGNAIGVVKEILGGAASALGTILDGAWDAIVSGFKGALNIIIDAWNALDFTVPEFKVGPAHFGGWTVGLPDIPRLHDGGMTTSSGLVNMKPGEELVWLPSAASVIPTTSTSSGNTFAVTVNGAERPEPTAREAAHQMRILAMAVS